MKRLLELVPLLEASVRLLRLKLRFFIFIYNMQNNSVVNGLYVSKSAQEATNTDTI